MTDTGCTRFRRISLVSTVAMIFILTAIWPPALWAGEKEARYARWLEHSRKLRSDPSLVVYFDFEGDEVAILTNKAAGGPNDPGHAAEKLNMKIYGAAWTTTEGRWKGKGGLRFHGSGDFASPRCCERVRVAGMPSGGQITLEAWYISYVDGEEQAIVACGDTKDYFFWLLRRTKADKIGLWIGHAANTRHAASWTSDRAVSKGVWHHVVATYNKDAEGLVAVYLDGRLLAGSVHGGGGEIASPTSYFEIGCDDDVHGNTFNGIIDEVAIYKRALTADEIRKHYMMGRPAVARRKIPKMEERPSSQKGVLEGDFIPVVNPVRLSVDRLPAQRIPLGKGYKPNLAKLPSGELLLAWMDGRGTHGKDREEFTVLHRSTDGGLTWSIREDLPLLGREPYLSVLDDGTVFITAHFLTADWRNKDGYVTSYLHRSTNGGRTWTSKHFTVEGLPGDPPKVHLVTNRKVFKRADGTLLLGLSCAPGSGMDYVFRSTDGGKTWEKPLRVRHAAGATELQKSQLSNAHMFGEADFWQIPSDRMFLVSRVPCADFPAPEGRPVPTGTDEEDTRMAIFESTDGGATWGNGKGFGDYGEMYPSMLRLQDGRLLFTFTVRGLKPPLGVRAVLGYEDERGVHFDFEQDRLVLSAKTPVGTVSGGGFGNTVQLDDGTLVTPYSYHTPEEKTLVEVVRWKLPPRQQDRR